MQHIVDAVATAVLLVLCGHEPCWGPNGYPVRQRSERELVAALTSARYSVRRAR